MRERYSEVNLVLEGHVRLLPLVPVNLLQTQRIDAMGAMENGGTQWKSYESQPSRPGSFHRVHRVEAVRRWLGQGIVASNPFGHHSSFRIHRCPFQTMAQYQIGAPYYALARHPEDKPYNKMHEDGLPQKLGFRGAFVLGVALYGYMTRALVASLGEAWLGRAVTDVRFLRPVCPGDRIRMETAAVPGEGGHAFEVAMHNETSGNELSAQLKTSVPSPFPDVNATALEKPNEWEGPVTQRRTWDTVVTGKAYRSL